MKTISVVLTCIILATTPAFADLAADQARAQNVYNQDAAGWQSFEGGYTGGCLYFLTVAAGYAYGATVYGLQGDSSDANAWIQAALYNLNIQATNAPDAGLVYEQFPNDVGDTQGIVYKIYHDLGN